MREKEMLYLLHIKNNRAVRGENFPKRVKTRL